MEVIQKMRHELDVEEIQRINETIEMETKLEVEKIKAAKERNTKKIDAESILNLAKKTAEAEAFIELASANEYATNLRAQADN